MIGRVRLVTLLRWASASSILTVLFSNRRCILVGNLVCWSFTCGDCDVDMARSRSVESAGVVSRGVSQVRVVLMSR